MGRPLPPIYRNSLAALAGVLLVGLPMAGFNWWLDGLAFRRLQEELRGSAARTVTLAESRLDRAVVVLDNLAANGVKSCTLGDIEALQRAVLFSSPIKTIYMLRPDGEAACSDAGFFPPTATVLDAQLLPFRDDLTLEVIQIGSQLQPFVRVVRHGAGGENSLAAVVPRDLLMPITANSGGVLGTNGRISMANGTVVNERGIAGERIGDLANRLVSETRSDRYDLDVTMTLPHARLVADRDDLRNLGSTISGGVSLVIFVFAWLASIRARDNPVEEIERGLMAGEFVPYYQPVVDIVTGQLRGAEVLIRWRKRDGRIVPPMAFIPLAESSGLIVDITRALMRDVCREIGEAYRLRPQLRIGFNLAARQFADHAIVRDLDRIFAPSPIRLSQVVVEVTERQPLESLAEARAVIAAIQKLGVRVAIDDVGAGHSGLSYILMLGVDMIKIDKMFIDALGTEGNSAPIVQTLIDLARSMDMDVVAEGVETFDQVVALRERGVRVAQGFVFAPPLPGPLFLRLLEAMEPPAADPAHAHRDLPRLAAAPVDEVSAA
jgi:sensor c-di-GMP phosphodiesterase-like protein